MKYKITAGILVKSIAGRDTDVYYLVMAVDGDYAMVVDGKKHKLIKPKKKKLKHLKTTGVELVDTFNRIIDKMPITDAELNKIIKQSIQKTEVSNV